MVLNNVTKFHKILIKTIQLREDILKTVNFHKQRAISAESMVRYGPLSLLLPLSLSLLLLWTIEDIMVLNNATKFHKILIKSI